MGDLTPIPTRYAGCHFRSRLEARWAVFFDTLGIGWEYEPEGFIGTDKSHYLPDFWLPGTEAWVEIKGRPLSESERMKFFALASEVAAVGQRCRILGPIPRTYSEMAGMAGVVCALPLPEYVVLPVPAREPPVDGPLELELSCYAGIPLEHWRLVPSVWVPGHSSQRLQAALYSARSARFEHGESGAT